MDHLARMVDPDLGFGAVAEAQMQNGLLVAPLTPAVSGNRPHRQVAGLVVVEGCDPIRALLETPLIGSGASVVGDFRKLRVKGKPVLEHA